MPVFKSTGAEYAAVLDSVGKSFQGTAAIKSLSLKIPTAGVFALVGPDGAGKSTLLQMLCGLLPPESLSARRFRNGVSPVISNNSSRLSE